MTKKKSSEELEKQKFEQNEMGEASLFYVVFDNECIILEGRITFLKHEAERIHDQILENTLQDYSNAPNLAYRQKIADQLTSLKLVPLRIH